MSLAKSIRHLTSTSLATRRAVELYLRRKAERGEAVPRALPSKRKDEN